MTSPSSPVLRSSTISYSLHVCSDAFMIHKGCTIVIPAEDISLSKKYTLKIYVRSGVSETDRAVKAKLAKEAKLLDLAAHPHIAKCYEMGRGILELGSKIFFVDFLAFEQMGDSLFDLFAKASKGKTILTESKIKTWFRQIAETIGFLHSKGIVHGGLSLSDVYFAQEGAEIKLLDFSNAELTNARNFADDVYMMGVLLFFMRTMRCPFGEDKEGKKNVWKDLFYSPWRLYYWEGVAQQVKGISVDFINLINGMLEAEGTRRFTAERVLKHQYLVSK